MNLLKLKHARKIWKSEPVYLGETEIEKLQRLKKDENETIQKELSNKELKETWKARFSNDWRCRIPTFKKKFSRSIKTSN